MNVWECAPWDENLTRRCSECSRASRPHPTGGPSEKDFKGLFDDLDVSSSKLGNTFVKRNEKLVRLLDAIGDLTRGNLDDNAIDLFGDAYEYL